MKESTNRYFICPLLPREQVQSLNGSIAANNFCNNLINGNIFTEVLPFLPVGYTGQPELLYDKRQRVKLLCNTKWRHSKFLHSFAFISENIKIFKAIQKKSVVWFYNLPYTILFLYILLKLFKPSVKCNIIMLDFTPNQRGFRALYERLSLSCINSMHGMIKLADSPLFKVNNSVCLPGVVPVGTYNFPKVHSITKSFLISGVLSENISMLTTLLHIFSESPDLTLHITGNAPDKELVNKYTSEYNNIIYHGLVNYDEYLQILHQCPFILSTRNPNYPENQCNFPSKIIESLLHNRIIVSTIHYEQLEGVRYIEVSSNGEKLMKDLQNIFTKSEDELLLYANQSDAVKEKYSSDVWNRVILNIENKSTK